MFPLDLHVVWREGDAGGMLRGIEQSSSFSSFGPAGIWVMKTSASVRASLKASLVDFDSLRSS